MSYLVELDAALEKRRAAAWAMHLAEVELARAQRDVEELEAVFELGSAERGRIAEAVAQARYEADRKAGRIAAAKLRKASA